MPLARAIVRGDRGCQDDERLGTGLEVGIQPTLANDEIDDASELPVDRREVRPILARAARRDAHDRQVLVQIRRDRGVPLDDDDVGGRLWCADLEPRRQQLSHV